MSDYVTSITNLYNLRTSLASLEQEYQLVLRKLERGDDPALRKQLQSLNSKITKTKQAINNSVTLLYSDPITDPLLQIDEPNPLLLLPLRMETRFATGGKELWVRVYPDQIAIQSHETALTESEIKGGRYFWKTLWSFNNKPEYQDARKNAWSQVANHFGPNRAGWIILKTQPLKLLPNEDFSKILNEADLDPDVVETKKQAWGQAAKSFVMPDLLKLRLFIGNQMTAEILGQPIVQPLSVGPDPLITSTGTNLDWTNTEIDWLQDFDRAVDIGMGFKVSLSTITGYDPLIGFSRITVLGIRTLYDQSPLVVSPLVAGTKAVDDLLKSHQYIPAGLSFVSQATPTNNTEERNSGYKEQIQFSEERYQQELQQASVSSDYDEMEDGKIFARALGLDPARYAKMENSIGKDHREAVCMNKAMYHATLGFYLRQLLNPLFKTDELDSIRSFFCSYVTGRGPIPAIRTGAQTYGILPTSDFKKFQWNAADKYYKLFQNLTQLLSRLDTTYETAIPALSKLGQSKPAFQLLDEILSLYPNSETFYQRVGYSENSLRNCLGQTLPPVPNPVIEQLIKAFSTFSGTAAEGMLEAKKLVLERTTLLLNRDRLVDIIPASEKKSISIPDSLKVKVHGVNYIQWLSQIYIRDQLSGVEKDYYSGTDPKIEPPILFKILKHSYLNQLYKCIFHWLSTHKELSPGLSIFRSSAAVADFMSSKEYLNFFTTSQDISAMELMLVESTSFPVLAAGETTAAYFVKNSDAILAAIYRIFRRIPLPPEIVQDFRDFKEFFSILDSIADLPTARLERTMIEHLDCLTYRLDAWQTGLSYKKLESNRNAGLVNGLLLGAFGWLENVKPAANVKFIQETDLPAELRPGKGKPIIQAVNNGGYIHAPSLVQAKTAALLRDAYLHHYVPTDPALMAVNLNSSRVRKALEIFEGIQKGHTIGELLGYRFERYLHDQPSPLDKVIPKFRSAFPLNGKRISNPGNSTEQPSTSDDQKPEEWVARMDGLALVNASTGQNPYPFGLRLNTIPDEDKIIRRGIDDLIDAVDAMKDLMVAESVHQLVQGNTDRAGALLKSIADLKPPAKFECIRTPRTPANMLTHRIAVLFDAGKLSTQKSPWSNVNMSPRALTEPALNAWLAEVIGSPENYQCEVTEIETRTNGYVNLQDLNLQPIDLVYLSPTEFGKEESEIYKRVAYNYRQVQNLSEEENITIAFDKADRKYSSLQDLLPLLNLLKEMVTGSKSLDGQDFDLQPTHQLNSRNLNSEIFGGVESNIGLLLSRKDKLTTSFKTLFEKLIKLTSNRQTTCQDLRDCLHECSYFEIRNSIPTNSVGEDKNLKMALLSQAEAAISEMQKMLDKVSGIRGTDEASSIKAFNIFFGEAFKVLPVFHFSKLHDDEVDRKSVVGDAFGKEKDLFSFIEGKTKLSQGKHLQNWLSEVTYVRPKLRAFENTRLLVDALIQKQVELNVMQLPFEKNDNWLGIEFSPGMKLNTNKLSMLMHQFPAGNIPDWAAGDFSGLLVDEWQEEIPSNEELTGISFQYNQPDSQPPQCILMAVSPTEGGKWDWNKLSGIIDDTLRRAKQRAIGTSELSKTDWIGVVPGLISEFSQTGANLSLFYRN